MNSTAVKTLKWWVQTITRVKREKSELETALRAKEEYISVYLQGLRLDKDEYKSDEKTYYTQASVDRYNRYIEELPGDKERLEKKKGYLEKLLRRAKNASVPKKVRGD